MAGVSWNFFSWTGNARRRASVRRSFLLFLSPILLPLSGCFEIVPYPVPSGAGQVPEVTNILLELIDQQESFAIDQVDFQSTSLRYLITLGTPAGYRIRLRYTELGVSLVEALKFSRDRQLLSRLFELAQFSDSRRVRAESLVTIGSFSDADDLRYFQQALTAETDIAIRFAAIEGLREWRRAGALELLQDVMRSDWSPLLQVYAAQAAASMGDASAVDFLWTNLGSRSWIVRAMSARYLGENADPADVERLFRAFQRESRNEFVIAEMAVAILTLLSRQAPTAAVYTPPTKASRESGEVAYTISEDNVVEMAPLIIRPPRLRIPQSVRIEENINNRLLFLIRGDVDDPLDAIDQNDPNLQDLNRMVTPAGFALQVRYSELPVLLIEGLGGTGNELLRKELVQFAERDRNPLVRGSALLSIAYNGREADAFYILQALDDPDAVVRFAAMEAVLVGRFDEAIPDLAAIAREDPIPAFQVFAMRVLASFGDIAGRDFLLTSIDNPDWPARAMSYWYLGRYGTDADYTLILSRFGTEQNPFVRSEMALAAARLAPL